jgi:iron(III) transport system permease protein
VGLLALPVLAVLASWLPWGGCRPTGASILREMAATVLPGYVWTTLWLGLMVAVGAAVVGTATAAAVTLFEFPGRRTFEWLLLLPLAMPAYVTAYAYTDFLQFSGPLQVGCAQTFGWKGRLLPEVRSLWGAASGCSLFAVPLCVPAGAHGAGRARGAPDGGRAPAGRAAAAPHHGGGLPLARPAVAAGVALALMETLADFGVASYFGIQTFTTGIYKAWLSMDNRMAAAQLATMLLVVVLVLLWLEHRAQRACALPPRARPARGPPRRSRVPCAVWRAPGLGRVRPAGADGFCGAGAFMLRPLAADWSVLPWDRFVEWAWNSVRLGGITAALAVAVALALAFAVRRRPDLADARRGATGQPGLCGAGRRDCGGLLLPVGWLQAPCPQWGVGALVTTTAVGIVWAYLVRFCAVALQSVQSGYARIPPAWTTRPACWARAAGPDGAVHWPLLRRSTAAAALLVFVDVMKELPATMVLRPFNSDTLAVVAYQLARDERLGEAACLRWRWWRWGWCR